MPTTPDKQTASDALFAESCFLIGLCQISKREIESEMHESMLEKHVLALRLAVCRALYSTLLISTLVKKFKICCKLNDACWLNTHDAC